MGFAWFLVVRFLQGIAYSADFAAIGLLCSRWVRDWKDVDWKKFLGVFEAARVLYLGFDMLQSVVFDFDQCFQWLCKLEF